MRVNFFAVVRLVKACLPFLKQVQHGIGILCVFVSVHTTRRRHTSIPTLPPKTVQGPHRQPLLHRGARRRPLRVHLRLLEARARGIEYVRCDPVRQSRPAPTPPPHKQLPTHNTLKTLGRPSPPASAPSSSPGASRSSRSARPRTPRPSTPRPCSGSSAPSAAWTRGCARPTGRSISRRCSGSATPFSRAGACGWCVWGWVSGLVG